MERAGFMTCTAACHQGAIKEPTASLFRICEAHPVETGLKCKVCKHWSISFRSPISRDHFFPGFCLHLSFTLNYLILFSSNSFIWSSNRVSGSSASFQENLICLSDKMADFPLWLFRSPANQTSGEGSGWAGHIKIWILINWDTSTLSLYLASGKSIQACYLVLNSSNSRCFTICARMIWISFHKWSLDLTLSVILGECHTFLLF